MQRGNWVPIDKGLVSSLPVPGSREYSEVEAAFCITCDLDNGNLVSQNGYATLWSWSRGRVGRFAEKTGWSISKETPRGLNKLEVDRTKTGSVIHDPSWNKRTTNDTTDGQPMMQPTDNRRTTGGRPGINKNSSLGGVAGNQQATDGQPMMQPTDNRRTTGGTLLSILDPEPDPEPNKTTTVASCPDNDYGDCDGGSGTPLDEKKKEYMEFASGFYTFLAEKQGGKKKISKGDLLKAVDTLDKLVRIDEYDWATEVQPAIRWAVKDEFWEKQIRNLSPLRKKSASNGLKKFENIFNSFSSENAGSGKGALISGNGKRRPPVNNQKKPTAEDYERSATRDEDLPEYLRG
jgi:hypothetical protein